VSFEPADLVRLSLVQYAVSFEPNDVVRLQPVWMVHSAAFQNLAFAWFAMGHLGVSVLGKAMSANETEALCFVWEGRDWTRPKLCLMGGHERAERMYSQIAKRTTESALVKRKLLHQMDSNHPLHHRHRNHPHHRPNRFDRLEYDE
tara:strand:+ start:71 stop:508 length:438 start_codon:yes stop_codon:yes gene_type:complete